jgi:PIN domain nuclease of toxin-antitoxin system
VICPITFLVLTLGAALGLPVVTTDRAWAAVDGAGTVELIR